MITWKNIKWHNNHKTNAKNDFLVEIVRSDSTKDKGSIEGRIYQNYKGGWEIELYFPVPKLKYGIFTTSKPDPAAQKSYYDSMEARKELVRMWEVHVNQKSKQESEFDSVVDSNSDEDTDPYYNSPYYFSPDDP